jgi:Carboxypeptidase regulatory-like domain
MSSIGRLHVGAVWQCRVRVQNPHRVAPLGVFWRIGVFESSRLAGLVRCVGMVLFLAVTAVHAPGQDGLLRGVVIGPLLAPVPNARVEVRTDGRHLVARTRTDGSGEFFIAGLPDTQIYACATAKGLNWGWQVARPWTADGQRSRIVVRLFSAATIQGVVKSVDGKPVPGAQVTASIDHSRQLRVSWNAFPQTVADASGRYVLEKVPLGDVTVRASAARFEFGKTAIYLERDAKADVVLRRGVGRVLVVRVRDVPVDRVKDVWCEMMLTSDAGVLAVPQRLSQGSLDEDGEWRVCGLPEKVGLWRVQVSAPGMRFRPATQNVKVGENGQLTFHMSAITGQTGAWKRPLEPGEPDADIKEFAGPDSLGRLNAIPRPRVDSVPAPTSKDGATLLGVLRDDTGKPIPNMSLHLYSESTGWRRVVTWSDGSFGVRARYSDKESVFLTLRDSRWVIVPRREGGRGTPGQPGAWREFEAGCNYKLTATPAITIGGVVKITGGRVAVGLFLKLLGENPEMPHDRVLVGGARTNDRGEFIMDQIAGFPGRFWIVYAGLEGTAEFGPFRIKGKRRLEGLVVRLSAPAEVGGTVVGPKGKAIPGARVQLVPWDIATNRDLLGTLPETHSDADGRFVHRGMRPGNYALRVLLHGKTAAALSAPFAIIEGRRIKRNVRVRKRR